MEAAVVLRVLGALALITLSGALGGALFARFRQPAVLGELAAGIVLGNLGLVGFHGVDGWRQLRGIDLLAQVGVLFLLFQVGLESDVGPMRAVAGSSLLVATLGVVGPLVLGAAASWAFFPAQPWVVHAFVGATLCATSVGITARVLSDLGRSSSAVGRIVLGAAVIDDVLGLLVLAIVAGVIAATDAGRSFAWTTIARVGAEALAFFAVALLAGRWASRQAFRWAARLPGDRLLLPVALAFCFGFAWLAGRAGLAPIVGAFAAGLVLEDVRVRRRSGAAGIASGDELLQPFSRSRVRERVEPIAAFLVPVFFVLMGMRVDLAAFVRPGVPAFAVVLTLAAIAGKQLCAAGVLERGADRLAVGLGMIPRGEVGLIFAGIGASLTIRGVPVVGDAVFSSIVVMVAVTTLVTPPLLAWRLSGRRTAVPPGTHPHAASRRSSE